MNMLARLKSTDPNNHPAEDAVLGVDDARKAEYKKTIEEQGGFSRWNRVAGNQGEQFPLALAVLWAATVTTRGSIQASACFLAYVVLRLAFVVCYLYSLQPFRTLIFLCSQLTVIVAGVFAIYYSDSASSLVATICVLILFLLNFAALVNSVSPANHPPEDASLGFQEPSEAGKRWNRVAMNQGEQLPYGLAGLGAAWTVGANQQVLVGTFVAYTAARIAFAVCYLYALAPYRTYVFLLSQFAIMVGMGAGMFAAITGDGDVDVVIVMCCTIFIFLMNFVGAVKALDPNGHPPEDAVLGIDDAAKDKFKARVAEQGGVDRWTRVSVNQGEQFPFALAVLWGGLLAGGDGMSLAGCFVAFVFFRLIYIKSYLSALSPHRSIAFMASNIAALAAMVFGVLGAINRTTA